MDYQVLMALHPQPGEDPVANAEELLDAFATAFPNIPAVGSVNGTEKLFDLAILIDAESADEAFAEARPLILTALADCGLEPRPLARIEVRAADKELAAV